MKKSIVTTFFLGTALMLMLSFQTFKNENDPLLKIAKEYKTYNTIKKDNVIVADSNKYKWTISLCRQVSDSERGIHRKQDSLFISKADAIQSLHGDKLYKLYVKDLQSYNQGLFNPQPIGQVLVKETYNVVEVNKDSIKTNTFAIQSKKDLKWYKPTTTPSQLFIMYKEKESTNNDKGWVYGIVDLEKKEGIKPQILSNGKISSCISCHKDTKYDRVFGGGY